MNDQIFLRKYRVSAAEIEAAGEFEDRSGKPLAYAAVEIESERKVVVEVVPAASLTAAVRERLEAEAMAAKKLVHINIPVLCDFGVEEDNLVYVTESIDGTVAEEWVGLCGPMPVGPVLRIASQVVSALGTAAFHRIVHRAISPGNVVLVPGETAQGEWPLVKVLHFVGVVPRVLEPGVSSAAFGTSLPYVSPEQLQQGAVDFRSEMYSLGATMWFLLTGTPPPTAPKDSMAMPSKKTGLGADKRRGMPGSVRLLLTQMLAVNPNARPRDALAFHRQLQDCLTQLERREPMANAPEVPGFAQAPAAGPAEHRRIPTKALVLALFLAVAVPAVLVLPGYILPRVVQPRKPIGASPRIPRALPSATPASTVADSGRQRPLPITSPPKPAIYLPAKIDFSRIAPASQVEIPTAPAKSSTSEAGDTKNIKREVRRAEPAEVKTVEVRRPQPAPPAEGPARVAPGPSASTTVETTTRALRRTELKPAPANVRAKKTEPVDQRERPAR